MRWIVSRVLPYEREIGLFLLIAWAGLAVVSGVNQWGWGWTMLFAWFAGECWAVLGLKW